MAIPTTVTILAAGTMPWYSSYVDICTQLNNHTTQLTGVLTPYNVATLKGAFDYLESHLEGQITSGDSTLQSQITTNLNTLNGVKTQVDNVNTNYAKANLLATFGLFSTTVQMQQYVQSAVLGGPDLPAISDPLDLLTVNGAGTGMLGRTIASVSGDVFTTLTDHRHAGDIVTVNSGVTGYTGVTVLDVQMEMAFLKKYIYKSNIF